MVKVSVCNRDDYRLVQSIGHAEDARVCAAVSAILCSLAGWLANNGEDSAHIDRGEAHIVSRASGDAPAAAFDEAIIGLAQLEKAYPGEVEVKMAEPKI